MQIREIAVVRQRFLVQLVVEVGVGDGYLREHCVFAVRVVIDDALEHLDRVVVIAEGPVPGGVHVLELFDALGIEILGRRHVLEGRRRLGAAGEQQQAQHGEESGQADLFGG